MGRALTSLEIEKLIVDKKINGITYRKDYNNWRGQKFLKLYIKLDLDNYININSVATLTLYPLTIFKVGDISKLFYSGGAEAYPLNLKNKNKLISMMALSFPLPKREAPLNNVYNNPIGAGILIDHGIKERLGENKGLDQNLIKIKFSGESLKIKNKYRYIEINYDIPLSHLYTIRPNENGDNIIPTIDPDAVLLDYLGVAIIEEMQTVGLWDYVSTYNGLSTNTLLNKNDKATLHLNKILRYSAENIEEIIGTGRNKEEISVYNLIIPDEIKGEIIGVKDEKEWVKNNLKVYIIKDPYIDRILFVNIPAYKIIYRNAQISGDIQPVDTKLIYIGNGPASGIGDGQIHTFPYVNTYGLNLTSGMSTIALRFSPYNSNKIFNEEDKTLLCDSIKDNERCLNNFDTYLDFKIINKYYYNIETIEKDAFIDFGTGSRNIPIKFINSNLVMDLLGIKPSFGTTWTN